MLYGADHFRAKRRCIDPGGEHVQSISAVFEQTCYCNNEEPIASPTQVLIHPQMHKTLKPFKASITQIRISNEKPNASHAT